MFANATPDRPALYISTLGEPPLKMLRYQQQFSFFDTSKVLDCVRFLHLGVEVLEGGLESVLNRIVHEVEATSPKLVFVDSFRAVVRKSKQEGQMDLHHFVQRLSLHLTSWEATTFLIGEYHEERETDGNPVFTVADGIIWLAQATSHNSMLRKAHVVKMRGQGQVPGLHTVKISDAGLRVYPRLSSAEQPAPAPDLRERRMTGIRGFDEMLGGGIPAGYSVMIVGPSGSGKTILATQFIRTGIAQGEPGVIVLFEKGPEEHLTTAPNAQALHELVKEDMLRMVCVRPLDLNVDETMEEISDAVRSVGAKRLVIDSLSGLELALAASFREDFRESLYRMVRALVRLGVTVVMTAELVDCYTELRLSPHGISFLTDGIILQRYVELRGELRRVLVVAKMRGFDHKKELRLYDIGPDGVVMGEPLTDYQGILLGDPRLISEGDAGRQP
jgi:circadian clock protein KaiC